MNSERGRVGKPIRELKPVDRNQLPGTLNVTRDIKRDQAEQRTALNREANEKVYEQNTQTAHNALDLVRQLQTMYPQLDLSIERSYGNESDETATTKHIFTPDDIKNGSTSFMSIPRHQLRGTFFGLTREMWLNLPTNGSKKPNLFHF